MHGLPAAVGIIHSERDGGVAMLYRWNGKLGTRDGKLWTSAACCCGEPGCCSGTITSGCFEAVSGEISDCLAASGEIVPNTEVPAPSGYCEGNAYTPYANLYDSTDENCFSYEPHITLRCQNIAGVDQWQLLVTDAWYEQLTGIPYYCDETVVAVDGCLTFEVTVPIWASGDPPTIIGTKAYLFKFSINEAPCC